MRDSKPVLLDLSDLNFLASTLVSTTQGRPPPATPSENGVAAGDVNSSSAAAVPEELPERPREAPLTPSLFRYPASPSPLE
ncbi:geranylgeranyl transferase beta subunit [Aspergillus luchuensis]|uniref:Geranylgeranyl transferase beta subunit n=1 Tax=Aspergillus kawachii TaxID=1069201 RepID=A0A146F4J9_ASPKA|nr:geranylgeranyl transferase beta subunit [Aspergillus luchuensis]